MSEQERPSTGGRKPYQSHKRGRSYLYNIDSDGNHSKKHDADGKPIESPSAPWEGFMKETPEGSKVDWNVNPSDVSKNPHKRNRSSVSLKGVPTKKQKQESIKSLAGSIKICRTESPIDRTLWEAGDFLIETNHLFDRTAAVFSRFRETVLEDHPKYGHEYCTDTIATINTIAVVHDTLYGDPDKRDILRKLETNDELYRKEGGLREKVDTFYNDFLKAFNEFVKELVAFGEDMSDASTPQDVLTEIPFWDTFDAHLTKMLEQLSPLQKAFKAFEVEVDALPQPGNTKMGDRNSPSTEGWAGPGPDITPDGIARN